MRGYIHITLWDSVNIVPPFSLRKSPLKPHFHSIKGDFSCLMHAAIGKYHAITLRLSAARPVASGRLHPVHPALHRGRSCSWGTR